MIISFKKISNKLIKKRVIYFSTLDQE